MSNVSKGSRWRKSVQDWFTALGYDTTFRAWTQPGDDITVSRGMLTLSVETKDHRTLALAAWVDQADRQAPDGHIPVVVAHRPGKGSPAEAYVIMSAASFADLLESL